MLAYRVSDAEIDARLNGLALEYATGSEVDTVARGDCVYCKATGALSDRTVPCTREEPSRRGRGRGSHRGCARGRARGYLDQRQRHITQHLLMQLVERSEFEIDEEEMTQ